MPENFPSLLKTWLIDPRILAKLSSMNAKKRTATHKTVELLRSKKNLKVAKEKKHVYRT